MLFDQFEDIQSADEQSRLLFDLVETTELTPKAYLSLLRTLSAKSNNCQWKSVRHKLELRFKDFNDSTLATE